ncbi:MAG: DUF3018 family protein [Acidimicrobiia bacterium]|nr:DUF3018 family protein [Acidimicrobiia bacterium]
MRGRSLQERFHGSGEPDLASEARRQSLLVRDLHSEQDTLAFIASASDTSGWK